MRISKYDYLLLYIFLFSFAGYSQETNYSVSLIPDVLKKNAKAVVRKNIGEFIVKSPNDATLNVTYAITILNENGIDDSYFTEFYDKFIKVNNINAILYDGNGKKIRRIPGDEILDYSAISGYSIYEDNRVKFIDPRYKTTPFTVEYSYTINYKGFLDFPDWNYFNDYNVSLEYFSMKAIIPKTYKFHSFERNINSPVNITENIDNITYTWIAKNLPAIKYDHYSLPFLEYMPNINMAPSDFELDNYEGNCDTWENFGNWINKLNADKNNLPEETKIKIQELVKNIDNDYDKINALYTFLQNKTRYVSIQVGIGGYQPFDASVVDKYSYGDCKALTNYMKSVLEVAGIKSNYCLVRAGEYAARLIKDFPSSQFNHAFLCVPMKNDTIWLECTSQIVPFGYIGDFTDDRDVLLIDENGGKVVHTKVYTAEETQKQCKAIVDMNDNGNGVASVITNYKGLFYEDVIGLLVSDDASKKKQLYERINIPNVELVKYNYEEVKTRIPVVKEQLDLNLRNYGTFMGDRMMVNLNLMNRIDELPKRVSDRKSDIFVRRAFVEIDTIIYEVPTLFKLNTVPKNTEIKSEFGEYKTEIIVREDEVQYIRYFSMKKGTYPVTEYEKFVSFFEAITTADLTKMVLMRR